MSEEKNHTQSQLSESELNEVSGGGMLKLNPIGKINKEEKGEKPPYKTLPIDVEPK